ncbi:aminoacyl tRNA synthase complex-interacting multifunctional protein 1-like [Apostichopus japonicus]|uniref:aminoacyl tRNA synthase complex-interacting multifunctional protein 1-like n=1 Tax=Stichopus japonicus TaxID=307972 RepID=UPI003AB48BA3
MLRSGCRLIMAASPEVLQRLEQRSHIADQMISKLKSQLQELKQAAGPERRLATENAKLLSEVDTLKEKLAILEARNGLIQIQVPLKSSLPLAGDQSKIDDVPKPNQVPSEVKQTEVQAGEEQKKAGKKEKKPKGEKKGGGGGKKGTPAIEVVVDVSLLDLRVGQIKAVKHHPDADALYVEEVDCGEANPRTVVSGLVKHIPIEQMENKMVVLCCNLKPAKMRGILSQAMVMCASSPDKVEILDPPLGSVPGDRVSFDGYPMSEEFPAQMNPKKKIFEQIQPDLNTNAEKVATYKGAPFKVEGKGVVTAPSMKNSGIK